jgi:AraC family transcriptional regulator of adaptative response/methylated-DNA-[protein]-cysteine methyltransferase
VKNSGTGTYARIERVIRYIDRHFDERPSLGQLARIAGLSPAHFSREFRRWAGLSPTQYVRLLSLRTAQRVLADDGPVLAAAWDAGLSGGGRLHDLFVQFEAMTPGEYRAGGAGLTLMHGFAGTPFGRAHFASTRRGLAWLSFTEEPPDTATAALTARWPAATLVRDDAHASALAVQVFERRAGPLRLHVRGTNFQVKVWEALLALGEHRTLTYADVAAAVGSPRAARAVGQAVGNNPVAWVIPCHHVLRRGGGLGGYRWGVDRKRAMLAWELARARA